MIIDTEFNSAALVPPDICVDSAILAEEAGFGAVWKGESNSRDPFVLLSLMAACTSSIELGSAVYHVFGRTPVSLAIEAATLNEYTGGRVILGLGVANPVIAGWHGREFSRPLALITQYLEILRAAYSGQRVPEMTGDLFSSQGGFKLAFDPPDAPLRIYLAGLGPQMSKLAGKLADGILINMANPDMVRQIVDTFREGGREAGRDRSSLTAVAKLRVAISPHDGGQSARLALKKVLAFYTLADGYGSMLRQMGWGDVVDRVRVAFREAGFKEARNFIPDEMLDAVPMYAGEDFSGLRDRLAPYAAAGVDRMVVACVPVDDTQQREEIRHFITQADIVGLMTNA